MSPEQARGEPVDHRTDIWSFGVVLYEMLAGQLPFRGEYEQAVIYSILNEEPERVSLLRPDVPEFLDQLVTATLAKSPEKRLQEMQAVLQALRNNAANANTVEASPSGLKHDTRTNKPARAVLFSILAGVLLIAMTVVFWSRNGGKENLSESSPPRIVVLPLENLGPVEQEYFADGLTGEITSQLSALSGLLVIARSSAMQYKETTKNLQQIAEELRFDYVLEGTMQWEETENGSKRIRVNPALIKTADATQVWSQPYEADFSSAFKLQADIATTVAQALNITLLAAEQKSLQGKLTNNPEAYDIYLRAKQYSFETANEKRARIAAQLFSQAVALDTSFAAAYAALSKVQAEMYWFSHERTEEVLAQSLSNAQKALALAPNLTDGHIALGAHYYHGRLAYLPALQAYNEALRLQPNSADAYLGIGNVRRRQGQMHEAMMSYKKAYDLDPRNYQAVESIGSTYILLREYEQAEPFLERARSFWPHIPAAYENQALIYLLRDGDPAKARAVARAAHENGMKSPSLTFTLFTCNLIENNLTMAVSQLEDSKEIDYQYMFKPHDLLTAQVHGLRGERALAREKYDSARRLIEHEIKKHPEDSRLYSSLGIAYAGLGQKAEAIREGKRAVDLLPLSREAWRGSFRLLDLAQIYTMAGELDLALDLMDELLSLPTDAISVALLKLDPTWAPLREHPRYKALLTKYS